jgi:hypothetical protein
VLEEPAAPPLPDGGGTSHEHVSLLKLPPAGHGLGAQFPQPTVTRATATAKALSPRNPIFKAFMGSSLVQRSAVGIRPRKHAFMRNSAEAAAQHAATFTIVNSLATRTAPKPWDELATSTGRRRVLPATAKRVLSRRTLLCADRGVDLVALGYFEGRYDADPPPLRIKYICS